jgi:hypothetical protein
MGRNRPTAVACRGRCGSYRITTRSLFWCKQANKSYKDRDVSHLVESRYDAFERLVWLAGVSTKILEYKYINNNIFS